MSGLAHRAWSTGCVLVALAVAAPAVAQESGVPVVSLDEAIRLALQEHPAVIAADVALSLAEADLMVARGSWLPTLSLGSAYANSSNQRFDQSTGRLVSESYTAQVQASYELFGGGRRLIQLRRAGAQVDAADAAQRADRFATVLATTEIFYLAAAAEELVRSAVQRLERARQQLDFASTRLEVGSATRSDVLRAELEVGNAELAVVEAESGLRAAQLRLGRQVGRHGAVRPASTVLPETGPVLPPPGVLADRAERTAPAARAADAALSAQRAARLSAYTAYLPTVRASGGYDWFAFQFPPDQQSWSLRVFASFPIFNGLQREAAVSRANAAARIAQARARDARIAARQAAETGALEIQAAERKVAIARRAIDLAQEDLRVQEERYRIGNATILELQTSQVALTEAEVAWVRARQELGVAVARLEALLGGTLADDE